MTLPVKVDLEYLNTIERKFRRDVDDRGTYLKIDDPMPTMHQRHLMTEKLQSVLNEICIGALPLNILLPTVSVEFGKNEIDIRVDWHLAVYNEH